MKTNFKKLFVFILICISVVPSVNFKAAAIPAESDESSEIVNINSAQDWIDISNRIEQSMRYTEGKYFSLNNDIILDAPDVQHHTEWSDLYGTLNGNNHTITVNGRWMGCLITSIYQGGRITNVKFSNFSDVIGHNWGQIDNCEFTNPNAPDNTFVCENKNPGIILNCRYSGNAIALRNKGTITNCQMIQQNPQHN